MYNHSFISIARTYWSVLNFYRIFCWWTEWTRDASRRTRRSCSLNLRNQRKKLMQRIKLACYISRNGSIVLSEHQRLSDLPVYIKLQRVSSNWISGQLPPTLCNINLTIKPGKLCIVVGAVGSGKSSVLHLLLKELNPGTGFHNPYSGLFEV